MAIKHLTLSERIKVENALIDKKSFKAIGRELNKDNTTISKEVKNHIQYIQKGCFGNSFNNCTNRFDCTLKHLCPKDLCKIKYCKSCASCWKHCSTYSKQDCPLLLKPPYVCNGCEKRSKCTLEKRMYSATYAQDEYKYQLSESRKGISIDNKEVERLDALISPLLKKGQSIHNICVNSIDKIMFSEKTIYNYVDAGIFSARNIDMPRRVRYRPRKRKHDSFKVDTKCRIGRTYQDFKEYITNHLDVPIVELDSVEGVKGGKVILTIHFVEAQFMLAFLRDSNTSQSVIDIIDKLYYKLNPDNFTRLFKLCLGDNGSEFSNPAAIELDMSGNRRTNLFYCDPYAPYQKGAAENNHEMIRRILPKGTSFDNLTQEDVNLMMNHINSYSRKKLYDSTPYAMFNLFHGIDILEKLDAKLIPSNEIILHQVLLKK